MHTASAAALTTKEAFGRKRLQGLVKPGECIGAGQPRAMTTHRALHKFTHLRNCLLCASQCLH